MRPGGGSIKGGAFEREICRELSLWFSEGKRADLFERNIASGGRFTKAEKRASAERAQPGDIMAAHGDGLPFASQFNVECKHLASIGAEAYFFDDRGKSGLAAIIAMAKRQAAAAERPLDYMVIARQNMRATLLFVDGTLLTDILLARAKMYPVPWYHRLHRGEVGVMRFADFTLMTHPGRLLELASARMRGD